MKFKFAKIILSFFEFILWWRPKQVLLKAGDLVQVTKDLVSPYGLPLNKIPITIIDIDYVSNAWSGKWAIAHILISGRSKIDIIDASFLEKWKDDAS